MLRLEPSQECCGFNPTERAQSRKNMAKRSTTSNPELTHQEIASVAYALFEKSGCIPGRDTENWLQAEALLLAERKTVAQSESTSRGAAKPASSPVLLNRAN